uniref:Uncharacterized protein n=1 Tax=Arundo donax TaxID=35708 RepID=A0A0A9GYX4_ARUDO
MIKKRAYVMAHELAGPTGGPFQPTYGTARPRRHHLHPFLISRLLSHWNP